MLDFSKIKEKNIVNKVLSPREIFMSLPNKPKEYNYPRDVQNDVWTEWYEKRDRHRDIIIKMNTGSGKTVVGLLILKSCLEENKGPAIYVVPSNYLVKQVINEAKKLGINATESEDSPDFLRGKSILVINIYRLINGKSIFGLRDYDNIKIGSIIIDDVHACISTTDRQFTINIKRDTELFIEILKIFKSDLKKQCESKWLDIEDNVPGTKMLVPFWSWQNNVSKVTSLLHSHRNDEELIFNYPLLADDLNLCNCVCSSEKIEISPKSIPINKISSFESAKRRIFMSATLGDDSPFISHFDVSLDPLNSIISPKNADDIGERLILIPEQINEKISDTEIKENILRLSKNYNTVIIVPSEKRSEYWCDIADIIVNKDNIEDTVSRLKNQHVGIAVFINIYEGIDLPDAACRILVIDGISEVQGSSDIIEQTMLGNSSRLQNINIQKIEQGMGRGIRSNQDYCVVFLLGKKLTKLLYVEDAVDRFSEATKTQLELSNDLSEQLKDESANVIFDVSKYCLERDQSWIETSKKSLINLKYNTKLRADSIVSTFREAFNLGELQEYKNAAKAIKKEIDSQTDKSTIGWLKQNLAEYTNFYDSVESQQILRSANTLNKRLLTPIEGIAYEKELNKYSYQAKELKNYLASKSIDQNKYMLTITSLIESLRFEPNTANEFEEAISDLGNLIGFKSSRPECDLKKGPDNFWQLDDDNYFVIECKNGTTNPEISKHDCNQLNGSIEWFNLNYGQFSKRCTPLLIHIGNEFDSYCSPNQFIRVIDTKKLELLKSRIHSFSIEFTQTSNFDNLSNITTLLNKHKISKEYFVREYSIEHKVLIK